MLKKSILIPGFIILFFGLSFGQQALVDSLERAIRTGVAKDTSRVNAMNRLAIAYWYKDSDRAFELSREAVDMAQKLKFERGLAAGLNILGVSFDIASEFDSALFYYQKSADLSRKIGYTKILASTLNNAGMVHKNRGDYKKAIEVYFDALRIFESVGDKKGMGNTYNNIGLAYLDLKENQNALIYHEKALEICQELNDKYLTGATLTNLGLVWSNFENDEKALEYFEKSLAIKEELGDKYGLGILYNNMGIIYMGKAEYTKALKMYHKSEKYRKEINDFNGLIFTYLNIASTQTKLKDFKKAEALLDSAKNLSIQVKSNARLAKVYETYAYMYSKSGNYKEAYNSRISLDSLRDSLYSENKSRSIAEMRTKYETEKKEDEIAILNQQNTIKSLEVMHSRIRERNSLLLAGFLLLMAFSGMAFWVVRTKYMNKVRLEHEKLEIQKAAFTAVVNAEENERKRIAMELHDGLGQLLSAARLNVSVLEDNAEGEDIKVVENAESLIDQAIDDLRNISHNLMPSALIRLGLISALNDMAEKINSARQISVSIKTSGITNRLPENFEIAIYRVVQEAVNNILKHANALNIAIELHYNNENLALSIADDGKGMPEESSNKKERGIGWDDIRSRVSMFNGNMILYSEPGKGTQLSINFTKLAL
jgi:signal transduction histidine kinase/Tfp pilus assembly protein PilF